MKLYMNHHSIVISERRSHLFLVGAAGIECRRCDIERGMRKATLGGPRACTLGKVLNKRCDIVHSGMILSSNFVSFWRHFVVFYPLICKQIFSRHLLKIVLFLLNKNISNCHDIYEPQRQKTGLWGFRPGPTQTGLDNHRR